MLSARTRGPLLATPGHPGRLEGGAEPPSRLDRAESSPAGKWLAPDRRAESCCCDSRLAPPLRMPPDTACWPEAAGAAPREAIFGPAALLLLLPGSPGPAPPPTASAQATNDVSDSFRPGLAEGGLPPGVCVLLTALLPPVLLP